MKISVKIQFVQIYNERVYDMLVAKNQCKALGQGKGLNVKIASSTTFEDVIIENAYNFDCYDEPEALLYYHLGLSNRAVASHNMNEASSRSHSILTLTVLQQDLTKKETAVSTASKLRLVDLAGSER